MPYVLERWTSCGRSARQRFGPTSRTTDELHPGRVYGCIFDDETGLADRDRIGMDRSRFETDYPHADCTFPHSETVAERICRKAGLDDDETYKLLRGNAMSASGGEGLSSSRLPADKTKEGNGGGWYRTMLVRQEGRYLTVV